MFEMLMKHRTFEGCEGRDDERRSGAMWYYVDFAYPVMYDSIKRDPRGLRRLRNRSASQASLEESMQVPRAT